MTQNLKDKITLLALGSIASAIFFFFGIWSDQFLIKADYDRDRISNAQVVAKIEASLESIDKSLGELKDEMREVRRELRRVE